MEQLPIPTRTGKRLSQQVDPVGQGQPLHAAQRGQWSCSLHRIPRPVSDGDYYYDFVEGGQTVRGTAPSKCLERPADAAIDGRCCGSLSGYTPNA